MAERRSTEATARPISPAPDNSPPFKINMELRLTFAQADAI